MFFTDKSALAEISGSTFSKPPTSYDALTGYRWNTGTVRFVRVIHGELIVDNLVRFNNYGHHASYDYVPQKPSARAFRFVVLGDSFTNDQAVSTGWPERLQELLRSRPEAGRSVEVYEFSTDGGGLLNWYATFRDQLLPNFEFDSDEAIERLIERLKKEAHPAPLQPEEYHHGWKGADLPPPGYAFSLHAFRERYGEERRAMLCEMLEACKCRHFGIRYFDGYEVFKDVEPQALIDFYWLKYDGHWAAGASLRFAMSLGEWIIAQGLIPAAP